MRAIRIHEYGDAEKLTLEDVSPPEIQPGELLVEVDAAGINFVDIHMRSGHSIYDTPLPTILGREGAGTVRKVGPGVDSFSEGDRVGWSAVLGSYAELIAIPAEKAVPVPDEVESQLAAAVLVQGITAHYLAVDTARIGEETLCLVHGGAGGVATLLIQLAKMSGAHVVTTVSSKEKGAVASASGADTVIDYSTDDFAELIEDQFGRRSIDVVFDAVGAPVFARSLALLRPRGSMVCYGHAGGTPPLLDPVDLARHGSIWITRTTSRDFVMSQGELRTRATDIFRWISSETLRPNIEMILPLDQAAYAHRRIESRRAIGKTVLTPHKL